MGFKSFNKAIRNVNPKWLVKNENVIRFDLSIQRNEVWDLEHKSMFIHSCIQEYPYPNFLAQDNSDNFLWMLDGNQRFNTIIKFKKGEFALSKNLPQVGNDEVGFFDIAGLKYDELPDEVKTEFDNANFTIYCYKDLTDEERDEMFLRQNNGVALTKMELTRVMAGTEVMDFINEISSHEFFKKNIMVSDSQRNRFIDQEIIFQILSVLINGYNNDLSRNEIQRLTLKLKREGIPENIKEVMKNIADYIYESIPVKEKFMKKVNIPIVFNIAIKAQSQEIASEKFGGLIQTFFNKDLTDEYDFATQSGSAKKENVKIRIDELNKYFNENIETTPEYKMPEPRQQSTGKKGRPAKNQTIVVNPPGEPSSMAASASGSLS